MIKNIHLCSETFLKLSMGIEEIRLCRKKFRSHGNPNFRYLY